MSTGSELELSENQGTMVVKQVVNLDVLSKMVDSLSEGNGKEINGDKADRLPRWRRPKILRCSGADIDATVVDGSVGCVA